MAEKVRCTFNRLFAITAKWVVDPTFQKWNTISEPPGGSETA